MNKMNLAMHYVCTHEKSRELINSHHYFWVSNCGCRESRNSCSRSRMDVCLIFNPDDPGSGSNKRQVSQIEVLEILKEAQTKHLVARPYRNETRTDTDGICFCCDDCCGYFLDPGETCDKGELIAATDIDLCSLCGDCVDVCYFKARKLEQNELTVDDGLCYGCGLCLSVCPENCIQMTVRN